MWFLSATAKGIVFIIIGVLLIAFGISLGEGIRQTKSNGEAMIYMWLSYGLGIVSLLYGLAMAVMSILTAYWEGRGNKKQ